MQKEVIYLTSINSNKILKNDERNKHMLNLINKEKKAKLNVEKNLEIQEEIRRQTNEIMKNKCNILYYIII